ncbi:hypothetical protein [Leptospira stimsonii]|uniref:Uncharacterized protein n=1 Tax=Leptospira stimsonii TaxID=2202203 RepID=A0ABY2N201_9LEPT|nr:hypothetical protein [Leptospira stimsonii]TGK12807.1 hypothetical protein EHO98_19400 [Leptospira stimsonii]TGM14471.1 hypothetical protein EHQ90_11390 [Leptospira stimsonii]
MKYEDFIRALVSESKRIYGVEFNLESVLIGVRGITVESGLVFTNKDERNKYNDRMFRIDVGANSWGSWRDTMDPGFVPKDQESKFLNPKGLGRIEPGLYRYMLGIHKGHVALVQASFVTLRRDKDKNLIWDHNDPLDKGKFGVDIHASSRKKEDVDLSSVACTTFWSGWDDPEWKSFIQPMQSEASSKPKDWQGWPYIVFNQETAKEILKCA